MIEYVIGIVLILVCLSTIGILFFQFFGDTETFKAIDRRIASMIEKEEDEDS